MLRLFLVINFLLLNLFACKGGYESCKQKIIDSSTIQNSSLSIPIKNNQRIIYSKRTPNTKILKHDPFLNLYIVEDKSNFKHPFQINYKLQLGTAAVNSKHTIEGEITKKQVGLSFFALFSEPVSAPSILTSSCCSLEGIVTPEGIIEKDYINRFITTKDTRYADIGIRVKDAKGCVEVGSVDPYYLNNPFKKGDCIVKYNGAKISDAASLMKKILFSKIGSSYSVTLKRDKKLLTLKPKTYERHGGAYLSDTYLENQGIFFDNKLNIVKITKKFPNNELKVGDRLIKVNGVYVSNKQELKNYISKYKEFSFLLIERDHFQFFVKIN